MHPVRLVGGFLLFAALLGTAILSGSAPVLAQDGRVADVELSVLRQPTGAGVVPVRVSVESRRAIEATLSITSEGSNTAWEIPYALAANSEVEQILLVPSGGGDVRLEAELVTGGQVIADATTAAAGRDAPVNAVGVLGIEATVDEVQLVPRVGRASVIDLNDLNMLVALDTVVVSPAGLRTLTPDELSRLQRWVGAGHQLVVADTPGSIDAQLPPQWTNGGDVVLADTGLIRYIEADWEAQLTPGLSAAIDGQSMLGVFDDSQAELLNDAGFSVPGIRALAFLLLVYLIVAGPVAFGVLGRMQKQTLAWVVIPGLAVLFTAGVLVFGLLLTSGRGNAFAAVVEVGSAGASVTESVLIADDGRQELTLPIGWNLESSGLSTTQESVGAPLTVRPTLAATDLIFDIDPGGGGSAVVSGAADDLDGALQVTDVVVTDNEVSGSITNASAVDLSGVIVLVGDRVTSVGDLAAGASDSFTANLGRGQDSGLPELRTWDVNREDVFGFNGGRQDSEAITDGPVNGSAWTDWRSSRLGTAAPSGLVTAVGWTRDLEGRIVDGVGRTALVATARIPADDQPLRPEQIRTTVPVAPDPSFDRFGFNGEIGSTILVVQHLRPAGGDTSELAIDVPRTASEVRVWTGADWQSLELSDANGGLRSLIPDAAWVDETLWVEYSIEDFFGGDPGLFSTALGSAREATEQLALLPVGENSRRDVFGGFDGPFGPEPFGAQAELGVRNRVELDSTGFYEGDGFLQATYDEWTIDLRDGQSVTVWMNATVQSLDPYLVIIDPDGFEVAQNDDFNGLNSRIEFTARMSGEFTIETRPLDGFGGGGYIVRVETDPPPPEPEPVPTTVQEDES